MSNQKLTQAIKFYRKDPVAFVRYFFRAEPDAWQRRALEDIAAYPRVSVKAGQGVGKTTVEAWAILWFLALRPYARVVATAPTMNQLYDILWAEVSKWLNQSPELQDILKWTKTKVYVTGNESVWFATARTAAKPENMQGFHADSMLFIVDEASGVPDPIMQVILGTLSGADNKLLLCGNPNRTEGVFYDSHTVNRDQYKTHTISSADSERTSKANIQMLIDKYGRDSDVCRVRIFGEFPKGKLDSFISLEAMEQACRSHIPDEEIDRVTTLHVGVDVARFGDDRTVITPRLGRRIYPPDKYQGQDTMETAGRVIQMLRDFRNARKTREKVFLGLPPISKAVINVDDTGVGGGVTDRLGEVAPEIAKELGMRIQVVPVNNGSRANDDYYFNLGAELWGNVKERVETNLSALLQGEPATIEMPYDDDLIKEFSTRKYKMTSRGKIALERKEEAKKRGLNSPDIADSVALALYEPKGWLY